MLISDTTINQVKQLDILSVVSRYLQVKSKGNKHEACCPFHDEKTPSFHIHIQKQIYKCFGCGAAGDGVGFVMKHENIGYGEAVKQLAGDHGISIEYKEQDPEKAAEQAQLQLEREAVRIVLDYAAAYYQFNQVPETWSKYRNLLPQTLSDWRIGYAEEAPDSFYKAAVLQHHSVELLVKAGLVREHRIEGGEPRYYDVFQGRAMFPIRDHRGRLVAFTGRLVKDTPANATYKPPKYLNSPDTVWDKRLHLYGLDVAGPAIRKQGFVYLVEGHIDVVQWHQAGLTNTVGGYGTSLTEEQIKLLKQYTEHVVFVPDNDPAGRAAMHKYALLLIEAGIRVEVLMPADTCDPDDMLRKKLKTPEEVTTWLSSRRDYITGELLADCEREAVLSPIDRANAAERLGGVLELLANQGQRQAYYDDLTAKWSDFKKLYKLVKRGDSTENKLLEQMKAEARAQYFDYGFFEKDGCFYGYHNKMEVRICNFTFEIQYFVLSQDEPKYVCHFRNMFGSSRTIAITTDDFTSVATFKKCVGRLGNFIFEGNDEQLNKIKIKVFHGVAEAVQPRAMLYNPTGDFTTFANGLFYRKKFYPADRYGIVRLQRPVATEEELAKLRGEAHVMIGEEVHVLISAERLALKIGQAKLEEALEAGNVFHLAYYFLPFASTLKLVEDDDDMMENERRYLLPQKGEKLSFERWGELMRKAYGQNGVVMTAYYVASNFRDIIYHENNYFFPLLNLFGVRGSGKSKAAESVVAPFGQHAGDPLRLEGGATQTGIQRRMATARNGIIFIDEYKNSLDMRMIGLLKGLADGSSKITGVATSGNQTKSFKPLSTAVVGGQDLPTRDPALLSRCIVLEFSEDMKRQNNGQAYDELKELEKNLATVHVTCELLGYREQMKNYRFRSSDMMRRVRSHCKEVLGFEVEDRTALNAVSLLTTCEILSEAGVKFPFTSQELFGIMIERLQQVVNIQHTSDDIEQYFMVLGSMVGREIMEDRDFKVQKEEDGITKLFVRVRKVHPLYLQAAQRQGIEPLSIATIRNYLTKSRYFLEDRPKGVRFGEEGNPTSALVFNYQMMREYGIELETKQKLSELVAKDDDSRKLQEKVIIDGNAGELVKAWLDERPADDILDVATALDEFNENKQPALSHDAWLAHLKEYAGGRNHHNVEFNSDFTRFKLMLPF
ncbi:DNA primase [Hymenobacter sp. YC55]|uniref:DNA primase n=1 Tax=Hymenobacter sp. YC55 TaxID=3034019 RepID=UPI0023F8DC34|nr:DNA primase [Hymenobacter sp. YC55]MDF7810491.1 DNA primase [Hymenobacter sp. YC55]